MHATQELDQSLHPANDKIKMAISEPHLTRDRQKSIALNWYSSYEIGGNKITNLDQYHVRKSY